jgi:soluble lytic murein transglycosylase-like protein
MDAWSSQLRQIFRAVCRAVSVISTTARAEMSTSAIPAMILASANNYGVPPQLLQEIAIQESGMNPNAPVGSSGEIGMMQLMPATAAALGVDPTNLQDNIDGAAALLDQLLTQFNGNQAQAVAGYNCGGPCVQNAINSAGATGNWFSYIPASTQSYVIAILGAAPAANAAIAAPAITPTLPAGVVVATPSPALFAMPSAGTLLLAAGVGVAALLIVNAE